MWRCYYVKWPQAMREYVDLRLLELMPPLALVVDKPGYSGLCAGISFPAGIECIPTCGRPFAPVERRVIPSAAAKRPGTLMPSMPRQGRKQRHRRIEHPV